MTPIIRLRERKGLRRRGKNHQCRASVDRCVKFYLRVVFSNGAADIMVHICTAALFTVQVTHIARVWLNRVRLPILLLVVS